MLYPADKYYYLTQSGCLSDPSLNDKEDYLNVIVRYFKYLTLFEPEFFETSQNHRKVFNYKPNFGLAKMDVP